MNTDILSDLIITRVRSVSTMYSPENKGGKRVDRSCWAIIIKYEGETVYTSSKKQRISNLSHIMLLPKGCSYEWECTRPGHYFVIEFESKLTHGEPLCFPMRNSEKILDTFRELERKRNLKHPLVEQESIRDTYGVILMLAQAQSERYTPTEKQRQIAPALEYISQNYHKRITNDQLAALTGLSTVYFRKLFTETVGESPIVCAHRLRITKAKEMLKSDYGTLGEIARSLGYASLYDFSRDFKKHTGHPPSRYEGEQKGKP